MVIIISEDTFISSVWSAVYCRYIDYTSSNTIIIHHMHVLYTLLYTREITLTSDIIIIFILRNSKFYPEII